MTNLEAKQEAIKKAYGEYWEAVKDFVDENALTVYTSNNGIVLNSSALISEVVIFDVLGRKLHQQTVTNQEEVVVSKIVKSNQALLVKTTLSNGQVITKKVIY